MKQTSCESPVKLALQNAGVYLLSIPATGGRFIGKNRFVHQDTTADIVGLLPHPDRRIIVADAKTSGEKRLNMGHAFADREHQRDDIIAAGERGHVAGLFVESTKSRRWKWINWHLLKATSIDLNDAALTVDLGPTTGLPRVGVVVGIEDSNG